MSVLIQHLRIILWVSWIQILTQRPAILGFHDFPVTPHKWWDSTSKQATATSINGPSTSLFSYSTIQN